MRSSGDSFKEAVESYIFGFDFIGFTIWHAMTITAVCVVILMIVSLSMKRRLWKKQFSIKEL